MEKWPWGKNEKTKKEKRKKKEKKEVKKGKNEVKMGKIDENMGKNRFFSYFFPKHLQISIFFPHNDIIMGKKYENILKYPKKFPRALRARKNLVGKKMTSEEGGGEINDFFGKYIPLYLEVDVGLLSCLKDDKKFFTENVN